jgi:hypothetical protein
LVAEKDKMIAEEFHVDCKIAHEPSLQAVIIEMLHMRDERNNTIRVGRRIKARD